MQIRRIILPALCLAILTACAQPATISPRATPEEVRQEESRQEEYIAQEKLKGLVHGVARNKTAPGKRLQEVMARIAPASAGLCRDLGFPDPVACAYDVHLLSTGNDRDDFNAYADGKTTFITSGMVRFTDSNEELALILAHETAHNIMAHTDAQQQNMLLGLLVGAALDGVAARQGYNSRGEYAKAGMAGGGLAYSVSFEKEADYIGLYLLARAGYDYRDVPELWRKMSLGRPEEAYMTTTHPSNAERYVTMRKVIAEIVEKQARRLPLIPAFKKTGRM